MLKQNDEPEKITINKTQKSKKEPDEDEYIDYEEIE